MKLFKIIYEHLPLFQFKVPEVKRIGKSEVNKYKGRIKIQFRG